jgi:hypothetical protein
MAKKAIIEEGKKVITNSGRIARNGMSTNSDGSITLTQFKYKYKKPKEAKYATQLQHRFKRKQGDYNTITALDLLGEFLNSKTVNVQKHFDDLKKDGKMYSRKLRAKLAEVKVKDIDIDEDVQRKLDHAHVLKIGNPEKFDEPYMSIITGTKDSKGKYHAGNGQHTLIYETALAYHGLWYDYEGDIGELTVPFAYIETDDRSILRFKWYVDNGMASKKPGPFDHHRIEVLCYRLDGKTDDEYRHSHLIQKICEEEGYEPISEFDEENLSHPRAILAIAEMRKYRKTQEKRDAWRFILRTHAKHWPNRQLHIMEITLFGELFQYMSDIADVYSDEFQQEFMEPFIAIIQTHFSGGPDHLASESTSTFAKWFAKEWSKDPSTDEIVTDKMASLVLMLKLYRKFGGTHELPDIVDNFNSAKAGDLTDHLPKSIRNEFVNG